MSANQFKNPESDGLTIDYQFSFSIMRTEYPLKNLNYFWNFVSAGISLVIMIITGIVLSMTTPLMLTS